MLFDRIWLIWPGVGDWNGLAQAEIPSQPPHGDRTPNAQRPEPSGTWVGIGENTTFSFGDRDRDREDFNVEDSPLHDRTEDA
ncbi:hypothetical protein N7462_001138 [Penicillium macrosclerotiorum]|uniref:uncharacterized protein n=1 Tax=Penicillium macrosclerotiorum TaxID=303699 RepID=UPI0025484489|nr:uncharacterized protein N7462_001138 [Penicillium macrosclerotiorum]KAJ5699133.1 hypothetical protein N7462_001138 [Penicillium macrosclerotiorum]